jgi:hypothetical protein
MDELFVPQFDLTKWTKVGVLGCGYKGCVYLYVSNNNKKNKIAVKDIGYTDTDKL